MSTDTVLKPTPIVAVADGAISVFGPFLGFMLHVRGIRVFFKEVGEAERQLSHIAAWEEVHIGHLIHVG